MKAQFAKHARGSSGVLCASVLSLSLVILTAPPAFAQTRPLPLGTLTGLTSITCPTGTYGFNPGFVCSTATISCPNTVDITPTIGYHPTGKGLGSGKTIFVMHGGPWIVAGNAFANKYVSAGYAVIEATFPSSWFLSGENPPNLMSAACRPATLLDWVYRTYSPSGLRIHAGSGGAGALAYALSWYGLASEVSNVEITTGPTYSDIARGCEVPNASPVNIVATDGASWSLSPTYYSGNWSSMTEATGFSCGGTVASTQQAIDSWVAQSVLAPGALLYFPTTRITAWLCETAQTPNNSGPEGYLWLSQVPGAVVNAILGCSGNEGVGKGTWQFNGQNGLTAIVADMEAN